MDTLSSHSADRIRRWRLSEEGLCFPIEAHVSVRDLLADFLLHRYRRLQGREQQFLLPQDLQFSDGTLILRYRDTQALAQAAAGGSAPPRERQAWKLQELLPALSTLCECHQQSITGFAPFLPMAGRLVPPVSFFLPDSKVESWEEDRAHIARWLERCIKTFADEPEQDVFFRDLRDTLRQGDAAALQNLVWAEQERTRHLLGAGRPSFLDALTEAELLEHVARVYPYRVRTR